MTFFVLSDYTNFMRGWRDGSEVKRTDCCSRGPEFNSQQPHDGSHPSIMRSGAQNTIYIINKLKKERNWSLTTHLKVLEQKEAHTQKQ